MAWSPIAAFDGRSSHHIFTTDSSVFLLTGVANGSIAMHMQDINNNNLLYVCTGAWNITNVGSVGPPLVLATADFTPSPTDLLATNPLGKPGLYKAYPVVTLSSGAVPMDSQIVQVISEP
jgi:hypothetical protein